LLLKGDTQQLSPPARVVLLKEFKDNPSISSVKVIVGWIFINPGKLKGIKLK
jgi:hypothetical protein